MPKTEISMNRNTKTFLFLHCMVIHIIYWVFLFSTGWFLSPHWKNTYKCGLGMICVFPLLFCLSFVLHCVCCAVVSPALKRKAVPLSAPGGRKPRPPNQRRESKRVRAKWPRAWASQPNRLSEWKMELLGRTLKVRECCYAHIHRNIGIHTLVFWVLLPDAHSPVHYNTRFT